MIVFEAMNERVTGCLVSSGVTMDTYLTVTLSSRL